ncbi:MAG: hypothetical protein ABEJ56_00415 [Candidatus Nanohaloarchaea archaeon]
MNLDYDDLENIRPFERAAEDRGYDIGDNSGDMEVAEKDGENFIIKYMDREEAALYILAEELSGRITVDVRVPQVSYDEDRGVLISEEAGDPRGRLPEAQKATESIINTYAFESLIGQGDLNNKNTDYDGQGIFAYDFSNIGRDIRQVYPGAKKEAEELAQELGVDSRIDRYDVIGERLSEIAEDTGIIDAMHEVRRRVGVVPRSNEQIYENKILARSAGKDISPSQLLTPDSSSHDDAVIIS